MTPEALKEVLRLHELWLDGSKEGHRANLAGAVLCGANLSGANLSDASLHRANLLGANLSGANLRGATLTNADLTSADLRGADLTRATLCGANLYRADMSGTDLRDVELSGADLSDAKGIIRIGPSVDGYEFFAVRREGVVWIKAGCHWFTPKQARDHWAKPRDDEKLQVQRRAFVEFLIKNCPE